MPQHRHLVLDFRGERIWGRQPFRVLEPQPGATAAQAAAALAAELEEAARQEPRGGAIGYFSYEAGALWEDHWQAQPNLELPLFRLVCFRELLHTKSPPTGHFVPQPLLPPDEVWRRENFVAGVRRIKEYIAAGDIYQANLTAPWQVPTHHGPLELYERMRAISPHSLTGLLQWDDFTILSQSPESYLTLEGSTVSAEPIKGTIGRGATPALDARNRELLQASPKDRAENVMIVDLVRNDLGKVCRYGTVQVPELAAIHTFPTLHHMVSRVTGELRPGVTALQLFGHAFPCGSITGAPKLRAMEILSDLEGRPRGINMGAVGYFGFGTGADRRMEWNVAIRTAMVQGQEAHFRTGCGIVADSSPEAEYEEMRLKATALWQTFASL